MYFESEEDLSLLPYTLHINLEFTLKALNLT